jgi:hypothetical protein
MTDGRIKIEIRENGRTVCIGTKPPLNRDQEAQVEGKQEAIIDGVLVKLWRKGNFHKVGRMLVQSHDDAIRLGGFTPC